MKTLRTAWAVSIEKKSICQQRWVPRDKQESIITPFYRGHSSKDKTDLYQSFHKTVYVVVVHIGVTFQTCFPLHRVEN